jgi:outer membrane protein TolC
MKRNAALFLLVAIAFVACTAAAEETGNTAPPRHMTLQQAVQLALLHNHDIRIAGYTVDEKQQAKQVAKSSYFPSIRNDSSFMHVTDTELIQIKSGSLGIAGGTPIPRGDAIISQGSKNFTTSGTQITQPLTTLLKIKQANDVARAEVKVSREKARLTGSDVALAVHQIYYNILIAQAHRSATEARIKTSEDLQSERVEQVKFGTTLEQELIDSRAQLLQAKQDLLVTDLQLSDLNLKLNDLAGLPLTTTLDLDPSVPEFQETCPRGE